MLPVAGTQTPNRNANAPTTWLLTLLIFGVRGHVAVVTGGGSGLRFMICEVHFDCVSCTVLFCWLLDYRLLFNENRALVKNGAKVCVVALSTKLIDGSVPEKNGLAGTSDAGSATKHAWNVSSKEVVAELSAYVATREDRVDLLVSNDDILRDPPIKRDVLTPPLVELQTSM
ncbi:uncharacterized protein SPSK_00063 [Sporothrix schenckii 1099-18]|uniref:Uncharacterized protein n=1 Tax=Sporothrix schenckii 1099-18 TaxID=1397361 RepID=A0A0F2LV97_SPOSC|nr:uncharacterized protein SPSK_00063 [Sporothrix schenckii 1099-18]KJR79811.1 hypothetical protein SPSK_00063 [Sporothrix schenckii 1099-18]